MAAAQILTHNIAPTKFPLDFAALSVAAQAAVDGTPPAPPSKAERDIVEHWRMTVTVFAEQLVKSIPGGEFRVRATLFQRLIDATSRILLACEKYDAPKFLTTAERVRMLGDICDEAIKTVRPLPTPFSERELAQRVADRFKDTLIYDQHRGCWMKGSGSRWIEDKGDIELSRCVGEICTEAGDEAGKMANAPVSPMTLNSARIIRAVGDLVKGLLTLPEVPRIDGSTSARTFDENFYLLNTPAGVLDLRTGKRRNPRLPAYGPFADYITKSTGVSPAASANDAPRWLKFLDEIFAGDRDLIDFIQRSAGYWLCGSTKEDKFWFFYGGGRNGKGTFKKMIALAMGDYAMNTPDTTFVVSKTDQHLEAIARLNGARLVTNSGEIKEGATWKEEILKSMTGGDAQTARAMYGASFDFTPRCKLLLSGNVQPALKGVDVAIKSRLFLVPFNVTFEKLDPELREVVLPGELSGILRWMIDGFAMYQRDGLKPPKAVQAASEEYFDEQDNLKTWRQERCEEGPDFSATANELYADWSDWAKASGIEPVGTLTSFGRRLTEAGFKKVGGHKGPTRRLGIGLRSESI